MGAERVESNLNRRPDRRVAALAGDQYGVLSRAQLVEAGLGRGAIARRIEAGWLHRVHRGVYAVGHRRLSAEGERLAAVLACGPGAVLSHHSAAAHWGLLRSAAASVDVAVPCCGGRRARPGIRIHRNGALADAEVTTLRGLPVTTTACTLLHLATTSPRRVLERAIEETERLGLFDLVEVQGLLQAKPGRAGSVTLRSILSDYSFGSTLTRSELEERFLALCEEGGFPRPLVNSRLGGFEVDFLWREERLVVETDGHASHRTRAAFERDRARDAQLTVAGFRVVRFTYRQVTGEPERVTATLNRLLEKPV